MASVTKVAGGWKVRYWRPDGKQASRTLPKRTQADDFRKAVEHDLLTEHWVDPRLSRTRFDQWAERWMATTTQLKPSTRFGYESLLRTHLLPAFGTAQLRRIQPVDVQTWVADLVAGGLSPSRTRQAYQLLSSIMKSAVVSRYLNASPCIGVRLPRQERREMLFLTADQLARLAAASGEHAPLIYLLGYGGIRWGEAAALRRRRVDVLRGRIELAESAATVAGAIHVGSTKSDQVRTVRIPAFVSELLAEHLAGRSPDPDGLVFVAPEGGPLRHSNFRRRVWLPALPASGVPSTLRIHDLRHTAAALMIAEGAHPKAVQSHLGHSSIQVTMNVYGHLLPDDLDRLADDLDRRARAAHVSSACPEPLAEVLKLDAAAEVNSR